jgi:hypothetical protein
MAGYPPPYPPPPGQRFPQTKEDWKFQRRAMRDQARAQREMLKAQRDAYRAQARGLRRGSIVGPILVISVGVIFLLVQMGKIASPTVWNFYGHWWPLLLIGAGVIVLLEWGFDQFIHRDPTHPYARRSLGGGVVWLLILFGIVGLCAEGTIGGSTPFNLHFNGSDFDQLMGDKHESDQTLAQPFPASGSLRVDNPRGDVTISGTSDDNQIHIILHKEIYSRSDDDAANKAQRLTPNLSPDGNGLQLSLPAMDGARADLIVTVPATSSNTVNANHGDVHLSGLRGPVNITANHGDVELSAVTGPVTAHLENGDSDFSAHSVTGSLSLEGKAKDVTIADINGDVRMQGDFFGDTQLEHIRGAFRFHSSRTDFQLARLDGQASFSDDDLSADQALGPVVLTTRNRNITLDRISGDVTVTNKNGKVDVTSAPPLGNISVENRNGEVSVTLPDQASFNVHADTTDADIENDFALPVLSQDTHKSLTGTVGKGNATVRISTTQEGVSLKRASIQPLPPLPPPAPTITTLPPEATQAIKDAKQEASDAARAARKAADEAKKAAKEAADH